MSGISGTENRINGNGLCSCFGSSVGIALFIAFGLVCIGSPVLDKRNITERIKVLSVNNNISRTVHNEYLCNFASYCSCSTVCAGSLYIDLLTDKRRKCIICILVGNISNCRNLILSAVYNNIRCIVFNNNRNNNTCVIGRTVINGNSLSDKRSCIAYIGLSSHILDTFKH